MTIISGCGAMITDNMPVIEVLSIGTELTLGRIQDTNSHWIAGQVAQLGGRVRRITVVRDSKPEIISAFRETVQRKTDIIISTGGLGPTPDDVTIECLASLLGVCTSMHEPTLQDYMRRRNLSSRDELTPNLLRMATVPDGTEVLPNPVGWAPCVSASLDGARIFVLPGPPREMESLFSLYVGQHISENFAVRAASQRVLVNMYESEVSPLMQSVMSRFPGIYLKAYVSLRMTADHQLPIDIVTTGANAAQAKETLDRALQYFGNLVEEQGKTMSRQV